MSHPQLYFLGVDVSAVGKTLKCLSERKEPASFIIVTENYNVDSFIANLSGMFYQ
jgi:hypothetical protein